MLKSIIFFDEITIWWTKDEFVKDAKTYELSLNGKYYGTTTKTHYTFHALQAKTIYDVRISAYVDGVLHATREYRFQTLEIKNRIDVTKAPYHVRGDGKTLHTLELQKALDACTENDYLYFPKGVYMTGALNVRSNTEIYLDKGAVLQGTANESDYLPKIKSRFEGTEMLCYRSLLNMGELDHTNYGYTCSNVVLRGQGAIFGGGRPLAVSIQKTERERLKDFLAENEEYVKTCETVDTIPGRVRGRLINMSNCENIVMSGLTLGYGPAWNIHFIYSKNIVTYNCTICSNNAYNEDGSIQRQKVWNGDGWDPDSSEDCVIFNTTFQTGDDCIAIKSGKNPEGNEINRPSKNIYIFDCIAQSGHSIAIGSEMSGGVENVYIWDCDLRNCYFGLQIKSTKKRGGYVKNVFIRDSVVSTLYVCSAPYNDDGEGSKTPPILGDYYFENVTVYGYKQSDGTKFYVRMNGFEEDGYHLKNVYFNNVYIQAQEDEQIVEKSYVDNLQWKDIKFITD